MENTEQKPSCSCSHTPSRRPFLRWIWGAFMALAALEVGWIIASITKAKGKEGSPNPADKIINAGMVDQFKPGQVKAVPQGQFYLSRLEDGSFIALSRVCTHLGCAVPWDEEAQAFVCPCHGSTFDRTGQAIKSPASRPLDYYPVKIENRRIRVDTGKPTKRSSFDSSQTTKV